MEKNINIDIIGQSEEALQQKCCFWFHNTYPNLRGLLFAVPNGGARSAKEGKALKLTGVVSGVSDLILLYKQKAYMIELKTMQKNSKQSVNQLIWAEKVKEQGFNYNLVRSLDEFQELIKTIIITSEWF
jgi:hypothetical protein